MSPTENNPNYKYDLGLRLKECREKKYGKARGSKARCAEELKIEPQQWNDIEHGRFVLKTDQLSFYADFFGADAGWLLTGKTKISPAISIIAEDIGNNDATPGEKIARAHARFATLVRLLGEHHEAMVSDPTKTEKWADFLSILQSKLLERLSKQA